MTDATLYINKSDSRCGACDKGADPYELTHDTLLGWAAVNDRMKGCGATFTAVSSDYFHITGDELSAMRPDLPVVLRWPDALRERS